LKTSYRVKVSVVFRGGRLALGIFAAWVFIPNTARQRGAFFSYSLCGAGSLCQPRLSARIAVVFSSP
jgi:hypothetical protein